MRPIAPCLWFDGRAEEAAAFYVSVFPRSRIVERVLAPADNPSTREGELLYVRFELDGLPFIALDGGARFPFTEAVSFEIPCEDEDEADHFWTALVEGGGEHGPCGWLKDRFGLSWQVVPVDCEAYLGGPDPDGRRRAMSAMLEMSRLDVAALRRAYEGGEG